MGVVESHTASKVSKFQPVSTQFVIFGNSSHGFTVIVKKESPGNGRWRAS